MVTIVVISAFFFVKLWSRDQLLPVFEIGAVFVLVTTIYSVFPLLNYVAGGLRWQTLSDGRLLQYPDLTGPGDVGAFAWQYVVYLLGFSTVYLWIRGKAVARTQALALPPIRARVVIACVAILLMVYFLVLAKFFDLSYWNSYQERGQGRGLGATLPYFVHQISHNLRGMLFISKQAIILMLVVSWRRPWARLLAVGWIGAEAFILVARMGGRGEMVLLLLSTVLAYHRFVKPLTFRFASMMLATVLSAFVLFGAERMLVSKDGRGPDQSRVDALLVQTNEFQALWATAYDLKMRREAGQLRHIPWQIYVSDLYLIIPSQILPFYKWDPSEWYLDVIGARGQGVGFMFGVVAQGAVGLGVWELLLRGVLLGLVFAAIHRWYVRRCTSFWVVAAYLFLCAWTHYTFRSTSFYWVYYLVYRFVPFWITVNGIVWLLTSARSSVMREMPRAAAEAGG